jgi:hypothetical protein
LSVVPAGAPRLAAICAAVLPFPYCFDESGFDPGVHVGLDGLPPVEHIVLCWVVLLGLTPGVVVAARAACFCFPGEACPDVLAAGAGLSFFACPGGTEGCCSGIAGAGAGA